MNREEIKNQLTEIYHEVFDDASIILKDSMTADDIEGWDSLTHLRLIMQIEKTYEIKFSTAQIKKMDNVGRLIDTIEELKAKQEI